MADRTARVGGAPGEATRGTLWSRLMLVCGAGVFAGAFFTSGWPAEDRISHRTVPGFTNVCAFLLLAQVVLLILVALTGWKLARSAPVQDPDTRPFAGGHLTALFALLAVLLGGVFGALATLFATRVLGTPVPSGIAFRPPPANALQVPWPIYAFAAAPIGLVAGALIGVAWVGYTWLKHAAAFAAPGRRRQPGGPVLRPPLRRRRRRGVPRRPDPDRPGLGHRPARRPGRRAGAVGGAGHGGRDRMGRDLRRGDLRPRRR